MVTGNGTTGQIIHDLLLVELFDVKYYRKFEMWVEVTQVSRGLLRVQNRPVSTVPGYVVYHQTREVSGQSLFS